MKYIVHDETTGMFLRPVDAVQRYVVSREGVERMSGKGTREVTWRFRKLKLVLAIAYPFSFWWPSSGEITITGTKLPSEMKFYPSREARKLAYLAAKKKNNWKDNDLSVLWIKVSSAVAFFAIGFLNIIPYYLFGISIRSPDALGEYAGTVEIGTGILSFIVGGVLTMLYGRK